jgi:hypothetical protein
VERIYLMSVYKIAKDGSDSQSGEEGSPKLTNAAVSPLLKAGDTLIISPGVYPESINNSWPSNITVRCLGPVVFNRPGSAGDIMWLNNKTGINANGISLDGSLASQNGMRLNGATSGCVFTNFAVYNVRNANGVFVQDVLTKNNSFRSFKTHHIGSSAIQHGIYIRADGNIVDNQEAWEIAGYATHIYSEAHDVSGCVIIHCTAHDSMRYRGGFLFGGGAGHYVRNTICQHNTVFRCLRGIEAYGWGTGSQVDQNTVAIGNPALAFIKSSNHQLASKRGNVFL